MRVVLVAGLLTAIPAALAGQHPNPARIGERVTAGEVLPPLEFDRLRTGKRVRVLPRAGLLHEGTVRGWAGDTLLLGSGSGDARIPADLFESVWLRRNQGRAAAIGAAVGFVPGFLLGFAAAGEYCGWGREPNDCGSPGIGTFVTFGIVVGLPPAALGALVGLVAGSGWQEVRPASPHASIGIRPGGLTLGAGFRF